MAKSKEEQEREEKEKAAAEKAKADQAADRAPTKAQQTRAEKERAALLGAKRYRMASSSVGGHLKGAVVARGAIANFSADRSRPATEDEVAAGVARLVDKGAIVPVEEDDEEQE